MKTPAERSPTTTPSRTAADRARVRPGRPAAGLAMPAAVGASPRVAPWPREPANRVLLRGDPSGGGLSLPPLLQRRPPAERAGTERTPIQPTLDKDALKAAYHHHGTQLTNHVYANLVKRIQQFNQFEHAGLETKAKLHAQFARLDAIEKNVNSWMSAHSATMTTADRAAMFKLAAQIEQHHTRMIGLNLAGGYQLWTGLGAKTKTHVSIQKLWRSISANAGNIKIDATQAKARVATLAGMAKLLQGAHGRGLLSALNASQASTDRNIRIGPDWKSAFQGTSAEKDYTTESWAFPYASTKQAKDESHTSGTGTGSYVQIAPGGSVPATGVHGEAIPMPRYITLGHELGHALHNLRGTSQTVWGRPVNALEQSLWSNPEELRNIEGEENPLRQEHQLPTRAYHKPPQTVALTQRRFVLKQRLDALLNRIPVDLDVAVRTRVPAIKLADDMIYAPGDLGPDWQDAKTLDLFEARIATGEKEVDAAIIGARAALAMARLTHPPRVLPPVRGVAPKRGMSTRAKVLTGVGVGLTVLAGASYLLSRFLKRT